MYKIYQNVTANAIAGAIAGAIACYVNVMARAKHLWIYAHKHLGSLHRQPVLDSLSPDSRHMYIYEGKIMKSPCQELIQEKYMPR